MLNFLRKVMSNRIFSKTFQSRQKELTSGFHSRFNRRCLFFVRGDDDEKIEESLNLPEIDCVVLDIEGSVPNDRKSIAREKISSLIRGGTLNSKTDWCVRINSPDTTLLYDDLHVLFDHDITPSTIFLPKVASVVDLNYVIAKLDIYRRDDWEFNPIELIFSVECPNGIIYLKELCAQARHLPSLMCHYIPAGVAFNCDEYLLTMGGRRSIESTEVLYVRQRIVSIAKAYQIQAIDMGFNESTDDLSLLKKEATTAAAMGYSGKQVTKAEHIPIVQEAFTPSPAKVAWAKQFLNEYNEHLKKNNPGPFIFKNKVVSGPTIAAAKNVLGIYHLD